jgi:hypothetical protein
VIHFEDAPLTPSPNRRKAAVNALTTGYKCAGDFGDVSRALSAQNGPGKGRDGAFAAGLERVLAVFGRGRQALWTRVAASALTLATVAALVGGALLVLSSFLDVVRFVDIRGNLIPGAEATREGTGAMAVIGVAAGLAALFARWSEHSMPAIACAALGAVALAIVLVADLPDVTSSGLTRGREIGEADPGPGFWVELAGAVVTLAAGLVLARLMALEHARSRSGRR